jgi:hypothetical protein
MWTKKDVVVCFDDSSLSEDRFKINYVDAQAGYDFQVSPLPDSVRSLIATTVSKEFSPLATGISFSGWLSCSKTRHPDLKVGKATLSNGSEPFAGITVNTDRRGDYAYTYVFINLDSFSEKSNEDTGYILNQTDSLRLTIAHEFGHVSGLLHEIDFYEKSIDDPKCQSVWPSKEKDRTSFKDRTREMLSIMSTSIGRSKEYDGDSIMSYCQLNFLRRNFQKLPMGVPLLSETDRKVLKKLYP